MYGTIVFAASFLSWNVAWHQVHCNLCAMLPISALLDLPPPFWKFARTIAVWSMRCNSQSLTCCCKSDRSEEMATWIFQHRCYNLSDLHKAQLKTQAAFWSTGTPVWCNILEQCYTPTYWLICPSVKMSKVKWGLTPEMKTSRWKPWREISSSQLCSWAVIVGCKSPSLSLALSPKG